MADEQEIGLAEAIELIRAELAEARATAAGDGVLFEVGPVEVELGGEIRRETRADGGLRFWVLSGGLGGTRASAGTHKIKVTLHPVDGATNASFKINDRAASAVPRPPAER